MSNILNLDMTTATPPMPDLPPTDLSTRIAAYIDDALRAALDVLAGDTVSDQDVHDARKSLKKARGGLRLLRPAMADDMFRAHNLALRDAGRLLSPLRDSHSQMQLFRSLEDETSQQSAHIESALYADHSQARHELRHDQRTRALSGNDRASARCIR